MQGNAPGQAPFGMHRQGYRADQERQAHRVLPVPFGALAEPLVRFLLDVAQHRLVAHPLMGRQALHFIDRQLTQARPPHRRMEQAGMMADDLAGVRVAFAQYLGDSAFHHLQPLAVETRQVNHQPGALAQLQQHGRGVFHQAPLETQLAVTEQAPRAQPVTPVAEAAVDPALLLQGGEHARHRGLGQRRQVMQFFQAQRLVFAKQVDDGQRPLHRTHAATVCRDAHECDLPVAGWSG
ncbi:hypothetical protein D3C75_726150 [compost metagenome]